MTNLYTSKIYSILLMTLIFLISSPVFANHTNPLPANQAFMLSTNVLRANELALNWQIAPEYYLYVKQIKVNFNTPIKANIHLPQGELQYDAIHGRFEAYTGNVMVNVAFQETLLQPITMQVQYQGCSHDGFCYPPLQKTFHVDMKNQTSQVINSLPELSSQPMSVKHFVNLMTDQYTIKKILSTEHLGMLLLVFVILGLLLAFTPCVLPMVPILAAIIIGQSDKTKQQAGHFRRTFFLSFSYVLGTAVTYALAGIAAAELGASLQVFLQQPFVISAVSVLLVLLSLSLFGVYELQLPQGLQKQLNSWINRQTAGSYVNVFCMGVLSTLVVSPCVSAPLVGVLMYIAQTGDKWLGAISLFALGIGMGIPLLLIGLSAGSWLPKSGRWMIVLKQLFGLIMLAMAIWLFTRVVNHSVTLLLWASFILVVLCYLIYLLKQKMINRPVSYFIATLSLITLFTVFATSSHLLHYSIPNPINSSFTLVKDLNDFNEQLFLAKIKHQPVLLDFYADWCDACVIMDKQVFNTTVVKRALTQFKLLRIDLTANTRKDELLLKHFDVIAPPTVLFFDNTGMEIAAKRVVGELNAKEFLDRLIQ